MKQGKPRLWSWSEPLAPLRRTLDGGGVLVVPTESSYALAVDPRSAHGVREVFRIKQRPADRPLPVVAAGLEQLAALGIDIEDPRLRRLAELWPGALTVVVPVRRRLPACADRSTLAVRVPGHRRLRWLLEQLEHPLTATSANRSGRPPVVRPAEALELLAGRPAIVIDDGELPGGPPSTLVSLEEDGLALLRRGSYPWRRLEGLLDEPPGGFSAGPAEMPADRRSREKKAKDPPRNA